MYTYDIEHLKRRAAANHELKCCITFSDLLLLLKKVEKHNFLLYSKRRPGVHIYHILNAGIKRNGKDLVMYLVNDGVHAGACAVSNLHKNFYFRMGPPLDPEKIIVKGDK